MKLSGPCGKEGSSEKWKEFCLFNIFWSPPPPPLLGPCLAGFDEVWLWAPLWALEGEVSLGLLNRRDEGVSHLHLPSSPNRKSSSCLFVRSGWFLCVFARCFRSGYSHLTSSEHSIFSLFPLFLQQLIIAFDIRDWIYRNIWHIISQVVVSNQYKRIKLVLAVSVIRKGHQLTLPFSSLLLLLPLSPLSSGACRPCNNTEILMAVCTSDFGELFFTAPLSLAHITIKTHPNQV